MHKISYIKYEAIESLFLVYYRFTVGGQYINNLSCDADRYFGERLKLNF